LGVFPFTLRFSQKLFVPCSIKTSPASIYSASVRRHCLFSTGTPNFQSTPLSMPCLTTALHGVGGYYCPCCLRLLLPCCLIYAIAKLLCVLSKTTAVCELSAITTFHAINGYCSSCYRRLLLLFLSMLRSFAFTLFFVYHRHFMLYYPSPFRVLSTPCLQSLCYVIPKSGSVVCHFCSAPEIGVFLAQRNRLRKRYRLFSKGGSALLIYIGLNDRTQNNRRGKKGSHGVATPQEVWIFSYLLLSHIRLSFFGLSPFEVAHRCGGIIIRSSFYLLRVPSSFHAARHAVIPSSLPCSVNPVC